MNKFLLLYGSLDYRHLSFIKQFTQSNPSLKLNGAAPKMGNVKTCPSTCQPKRKAFLVTCKTPLPLSPRNILSFPSWTNFWLSDLLLSLSFPRCLLFCFSYVLERKKKPPKKTPKKISFPYTTRCCPSKPAKHLIPSSSFSYQAFLTPRNGGEEKRR